MLVQYIDGKLLASEIYQCSSFQERYLYLQEICQNKTVALCLSSQLDLEFDTLWC